MLILYQQHPNDDKLTNYFTLTKCIHMIYNITKKYRKYAVYKANKYE